MAEILNLRLARKQKARAALQKQAAENRALHGRSKNAAQTDKATRALDERKLDGHRRENGGDAST